MAIAIVFATTAFAAPPPAQPVPAPERAATTLTAMEEALGHLDVSVEHAEYGSLTAPHRLLAETRGAVNRLAATRHDLIGQPWKVVRPLLRRLNRAEEHARALLGRLENWKPRQIPTTPLAPQGTGAITGKVTNASDGTPLAGVRVDAVSYYGDLFATSTTDASGTYTAGGLGTGYVFVRTTGTPGFVDLVYDGVPCEPNCTPGYDGIQIAVNDGATVPGIDFALIPTATLSGHVTSSVDGTPIVGVEVSVGIFESDYWLASATTAADGSFSFPELAPGQYRALASHRQWADEAYDNVPCEPSCGYMAGTPVYLAAGQNVGTVNFTLDPTGSISGHVAEGTTGNPDSALVLLYNGIGNEVANTYTEETQPGDFSLADLPSGTYFAVAENWAWSELYREMPWTTPYDATRGTPVVVTGGQDTANIDFTTDTPTASMQAISGQVTDATTGIPLWASVEVFNVLGNYVGYDSTSDSGYFRIGSLAPGTYFVTAEASSYLDELYDNLPCGADCDPLVGTPVVVTATAETTGVDFALDRGGWIAGQVTGADTGLPVTGVSIEVFNQNGEARAAGGVDQTGHYAVFGLATGSYFVKAAPYSYLADYAGQLYSGILCETDCNITTGTPVAVTTGLPTGGVNFVLTPLGSVAGTVTDTTTGAPIAGARVYVGYEYNYPYSASTNATGQYRVRGVHSGNFLVLVSHEAFLGELYDNIPCETFPCNMAMATPIAVNAGNETGGIDFALDRLGTISGRVTRAADGQPVVGEEVAVYSSNGGAVKWLRTGPGGDYSAYGLTTGAYFVRTAVNDGNLIDELYDNIPCEPSCTPVNGTPISVVEGQTTAGIDFVLDTGGTISGQVTDEQSGTPVSGFQVIAYNSAGSQSAYAIPDYDGSYTIGGLLSGTYYVKASRNWYEAPYVAELYDNIPCDPSCTVTTGTPVSVTVGIATTGINFALQRLGGITGTIVDAAGGQPLNYAGIDIFTSVGSPIRNTHSSATGHYSVDYLAPGTYFVKASSDGFRTEVYNDVPCDPTCVVTIGTPVTVAAGATTNGINFALSLRGAISGRLTRDPGGAAISGATVNVFDATGSWSASGTSGPDGVYTVTNLLPGSYFVVTVSGALHNELYDNIPCDAGCSVTSGAPVTVTLGVTTPGIDFALMQKGAISGNLKDQATGTPLRRELDLFDAAGSYVTFTYPEPNGTFTFKGLAPGTYFVRTIYNWWGTDEFADELYNNIPCDSECTITSGTPIVVTDGATTTGIDFALERHGRITGRVTDAEFGLAVPGRYVYIYNPSGAVVSNLSADASGNFSTWYLPAGTYFLATRSYNAGDPWVDQLWQGHECEPSCTPTLGTPVVVANDTVTTGINFALYKPYFADVPIIFWARPFVDALYRAGITSGCGSDPLVYCPTSEVTRAQAAVFLGVAGHAPGFIPPLPTGTVFQDVPIDYWSAAWIELLWADGLTTGCATDPLRYCPESPLSRAEMSVFLLGGKHGAGYQPPPATGTVFTDVPITHWAAAWIEELAAEGITSGCAPALFCPDGIVDRAQMAVFLVATYAIPY